jgi:hypothetical protein
MLWAALRRHQAPDIICLAAIRAALFGNGRTLLKVRPVALTS